MKHQKFLIVLLLLTSTSTVSTINNPQKNPSSGIQDLIDFLETKEENTIKESQANLITRPKPPVSFLTRNNPLGKKASSGKNCFNQYKDNIVSSPTVLWTETLNFSYEYKCKNETRIITTGEEGNTFLVTQEDVLGINHEDNQKLISNQRTFTFDMHKIHQTLKKEEEGFLTTKIGKKMKDNNHVVAGVSLIFETNDKNYEALFSIYRKDLLLSLLGLNKKAPLYVFTSGQHKKSDTKDNIYESVKPVYDSDCSPEYLYNSYITNRWKEKEKKEHPNVIQNVINRTKYMKNEMMWVVNNQVTKMKKNEGSFNKLKESVQDAYFDSTTDSEQVFLYHAFYEMLRLRQNNNQQVSVIQQKVTILEENALKPRHQSHIEEQCNNLLTNYNKNKESKYPVVGLVIHIHTTRDCCQSCAYSLGNQLAILHNKNSNKEEQKEDKKGILGLRQSLKDYNEKININEHSAIIDPFITFMVSCEKHTSTKKELKKNDDYMLGRRTLGIPQRWTLMNITNYNNSKYNNDNYNKEVIKALVNVAQANKNQKYCSHEELDGYLRLLEENNVNKSNNNTDEDEQKDDNKEEVADSDDKEPFGNKNPFLRNRNNNRINLNLLLATGGYFLQWFCKEQSQD